MKRTLERLREEFIAATIKGDILMMRSCLKQDDFIGSYYIKDGSEVSKKALSFAIANDHANAADVILNEAFKGPPEILLRARYESDQTPLHLAARRGSLNVVELFFSHGAEVYALDEEHMTPRQVANGFGRIGTYSRSEECIATANMLQEMEATEDLLCASFYGNLMKAMSAISNGARIDFVSMRHGDQAPMHIAVKKGHKIFVKLLLKNGANMNVQNGDGQTPVQIAVEKKDKAMMDIFAENDSQIDFSIMDKQDWSLVHYAAEAGEIPWCFKHTDISKTPMHIPDKEGRTPLFIAIKNWHDEDAIMLAEEFADGNIRDQSEHGFRCTAMHIATLRSSVKVLGTLIRTGMGNPFLKDSRGYDCLALAKDFASEETYEFLKNFDGQALQR